MSPERAVNDVKKGAKTRNTEFELDKAATLLASEVRKRVALWIIIQKMVGRHQNHPFQDEEIYKLLEKAKTIYYAKSEDNFQEIIKNL